MSGAQRTRRGLRPAVWQDLPWRGGNAPGLQACRQAQLPSGQRDPVRRAPIDVGHGHLLPTLRILISTQGRGGSGAGAANS